jgi:hypothetical protein
MSAEDAAVHSDPGRHRDLVIDEQAVDFAEPLAVLVGHLDAVKAAVVRDLHVISFSGRACAGDPPAMMPVTGYRGSWVSGLYAASRRVRPRGPLTSGRALSGHVIAPPTICVSSDPSSRSPMMPSIHYWLAR